MPNEKFAQVLPNNWDGKFPFTNDSDEDFIFTWDKKTYLFPARKTVDMMKMNFNETPVGVQQIRKFAAKQWAEREFFKGDVSKKLESIEKDAQGYAKLHSFQNARTYTDSDLKDNIQRCLTPLPEANALVAEAKVRDTLSELHRDEETGAIVTRIVKKSTGSLEDDSVFAKPSDILIN